ncbi:MAG: isochorismatase family protein [Polyangiaceae bacterium]
MGTPKVLIDVDVQHDFCEADGALFVAGSPNDRFRALVQWAAANDVRVLGSVDSHAWDAWEFASSKTVGPNGEKPNFPDHCVKGTAGWLKVRGTLPARFRFVPNVADAPIGEVVRELLRGDTQAVYFEKEVYSLFANPMAEKLLRSYVTMLEGEPELFVFGVATDYCVKAAALGLAERGYKTALLTDAVAGITPEGTSAALEAMKAAGVRLTTSAELLG